MTAPEWLPDVAPAASLPDHAAARIAEIEATLAKVGQPLTEADLAHQRLVHLADGLKGIGLDSYAATSEPLCAVLLAAGFRETAVSTIGSRVFTSVVGVVEGVKFSGFGEIREGTAAELAALGVQS